MHVAWPIRRGDIFSASGRDGDFEGTKSHKHSKESGDMGSWEGGESFIEWQRLLQGTYIGIRMSRTGKRRELTWDSIYPIELMREIIDQYARAEQNGRYKGVGAIEER
jgi:hypothetical protein